MRKHFYNLFIPHHGNNHKARFLHHASLSKLVLVILFFQLLLTGITRVKPGVLGFASDITVDQVVSQTNSQRTAQGLPPLAFNATLADSARRKAAHMFANNYWAHNAPDGTTPWSFFKNVGYNYLYAGENLARDFGDTTSVVSAWMASPTHRDNIISGKYTEIGVAVVNGVLNGQETTLVVQHFGKPTVVAAAIPSESARSTQGTQTSNLAREEVPVKAPEILPQEPVKEVVHDIQMDTQKADPVLFPTEITQNITPATFPAASTFELTKSVNVALSVLVLGVLALDGWLIFKRKTVRRTGKSFVHLSFFAIITLIMILTGSGRVL